LQSTLQNAGIGSIDPRNIQIFAKEQEIPLFIHDENENDSLDSGDYIEFYAQGNDGWIEADLYGGTEFQNNPYYSLYNDTLTYFLTWNSNLNNLRFQEETNTNFNSFVPQTHILKYTRTQYINNYYEGELDFANTSLTEYTSGEGWSGNRFGKGGNTIFNATVTTPNAISGGGVPNAIVRSSSASHSNAQSSGPNHNISVKYGNTTVETLNFSGYRMNNVDFSMPANELSASTVITHEVDANATDAATDFHSVNYVEITYAHSMDFLGESYYEFISPYNSFTGSSRFDIENFNASEPVLYVVSESPKRIPAIENDGVIQAIIPNEINPQTLSQCILLDASEIIEINQLEKVSASGFFTDLAATPLDSAFIIISHSALMNAAQNYAGYRQSQGMDVLLVDADDLYKQYGGGIEKCPIAFRRFSDQLIDTWSSKPSHLFLLGKSIRQAREATLGARKDPIQFHKNLVPCLGYPCSDVSLTGGLNASILEPTIATGRLAAANSDEVLAYLDKVVKFEQQPNDIWKKNFLHFGGGSNLAEQFQFRNFLENFGQTAADTCWGAQSFGFYKDSSLPISVNTNDSISQLISNGVSIMTFFGHAFAGGFDQNIENPANLEWNEKFPLVIGNSCFTGDIHQPGSPSTSEEFVLLENKGAIGFLSSVKLGYSGNLATYTGELYRQMASKNYTKSIGQQITETIKEIQGDGNSFLIKNVTQSMTLQGDPSLIINTVPRPDLQISLDQIFFDPQIVTLQTDSFDVKVVINNIGKTTNKNFIVELNRYFPGSSQFQSFSQEVNGLFYSDTITFRLAVDQANGIGLNSFDCFVDLPSDNIDEMDNLNNNTVVGKTVNITSGGIIPVYPYDYAVYPNNTVTLKASTGDVFAENKFYRFELDTIDSFNSPLMLSSTQNHAGGVVNWSPPITLSDSTVYFWRIGELEDGVIENWQESSFQYIEGQEGWAQAHFKQFKNDRFNLINFNVQDEEFDFFNGTRTLSCNVLGNTIDLANGYSIDGEVQEYALCFPSPALAVAVIDPQSLEPWETATHSFGNFNTYDVETGTGFCRNRSELYFLFRQHSMTQMAGLRDMLEDSVPDGHYILIYTNRYMSQHDWDNNAPFIYNTFNDLGMNSITASQDSVPFAFFVQKGVPGSQIIELGTEINSILNLNAPLEISGNFGNITSVNAGQSPNWQSLHWISQAQEAMSEDIFELELYGVRPDGTQELLNSYNELSGQDLSISALLSSEYQNAYLKTNLSDETNLTPAQLKRWHLIYESAPEAAINPSIAFDFNGTELEEGQTLTFYTAIENISDKDMDSLLVNYWVQDQSGQNHIIPYERQAPLLTGDVLIDTISFNTFGFPGNNIFWVEVNPRVNGVHDQLEQHHFNNIAQIEFKVGEDNINPLLDVTFDGLHILDGEIVSPSPDIHIRLNDENPYLLMNEESDTSFFSVFLTPQGNGEPIPINFRNGFGEEIMQFIPASSSDNVASIYFQPQGFNCYCSR